DDRSHGGSNRPAHGSNRRPGRRSASGTDADAYGMSPRRTREGVAVRIAGKTITFILVCHVSLLFLGRLRTRCSARCAMRGTPSPEKHCNGHATDRRLNGLSPGVDYDLFSSTSTILFSPLLVTAIMMPTPTAMTRPMMVQVVPSRSRTPIFHSAAMTPPTKITYPRR